MMDRSRDRRVAFKENYNIPNDLLCSLRFFLFFFIFSSTSYSSIIITDTTKQKYELNDPRNPDCPCHKYQKLAEEEFKNKYQKEDPNDFKNINGAVDKNEKYKLHNNNFTDGKIRKSSYKKKIIRKYKGIRIRFKLKNESRRRRQFQTDYSTCFKW